MKHPRPSSSALKVGTATANRNLKNRYLYNSALVFLCALVLIILGWGDGPGLTAIKRPGAKNSFYNLLIQGFNAGQLNIITPAPTELTQLANPYDPALNGKFLPAFGDMSYYHGKLFVYYGVAPAIMLYWPYNFLTGDYLSDQAAVFIFLATGFLALAFLLYSIWKRYFENVGFWVLCLCLLTVGLAIGALEAEWWWSDIYEVSLSSAFAFAMLSLAAIWQAIHQVRWRVVWLFGAGLTYGLAIASRPTLLFGAVILLIPLIYNPRKTAKAAKIRVNRKDVLATVCPVALIGIGLMIYNFQRFGSVFEFGWQYCLGSGTRQLYQTGQFNLHFFWYNFYYYFLEPMRWAPHFPFLQTFDPPAPPPGYGAAGKDSGGILLVNYPLALAAVAAALAWRRKEHNESTPLRLLVVMASILFVTSSLLLCLFCLAWSRYELDFLPALMILSVIGIFHLEQQTTGSRRRVARLAWCLLLAVTLVFNTLATVEGYAMADYFNGNFLMNNNRARESLKYFKNMVSLEPGRPLYHNTLALTYSQTGDTNDAVAEYKEALALDPNCTEAQYDFSYFLYTHGQSEEAFNYLEKALKGDPKTNNLYAIDNIPSAWALVFNPDPRQRNGPLAIKLAKAACQETSYTDAQALVVAAEVFGKTGQTNEAMWLAQKAIVVAQQNGESNYLGLAQYYLALYQKNRRLLPPAPETIQR